MPFPEVQRVIYKKNPLDQVICQLRFPSILKISTELPAEFQETIRKDFPDFSETFLAKIEIPQGVSGQIPMEAFSNIKQTSSNKSYEFISEDKNWKTTLTNTFIALTCNKYNRWEEFKEKLIPMLNAFNEIYSPNYYSRTGLRYIDVIRKSILNLKDSKWSELLHSYIVGILDLSELENQVESFETKNEILLDDKSSKLRLITALVEHVNDKEIGFMIDGDYYSNNKIEVDQAIEKLDYFNKRASRLIRWCITEKLHDAMEPEAI